MSTDAPPGPLLTATGVSVSFGGVRALDAVDCHVARSEVVGIIGPNGAGKTTLLNAISRFLPVGSDAAITFAGHDLLLVGPRKLAALGLARTFQNIELSMSSSVWNNVIIGGHHRRQLRGRPITSRELEHEAMGHLRLLQIDRWAEDRVDQVPYATRKRAEICRALLSAPQLILLDEPASGMSAAEKAQLRTALSEVNAQTGTAILIIEHDVGFLAELCDRLMAINFGQLICEGAPSEVTADRRVIEAYLGEQ